jgi:Protein of unknown function (DUF2911)
MIRLLKCSVVLAAVVVCSVLACAQQDKSKRPSPPGSAECQFAAGKTVHIDYSRPSVKGRKVFGELVPYDKEWRTGANEATTFVANTAVDVAGTKVPAGSYTLFTVPSQKQWTLIISKKTGEWGIPYPGKSEDLARVPMRSQELSSPVEQFTISFERTSPEACTLRVDWETTRAEVSVREAK